MLLRTLQAQGIPSVVSCISPGHAIDLKTRPGIVKSLLSFIQYFAPDQARVFDLEVGSDRLSAVRALAEGKPWDVRWREGRAWVLGEKVEWEEGSEKLKVTGIVRGAQLSPNRLVHLPNFGDFQISRVSSPYKLPCKWCSGFDIIRDHRSSLHLYLATRRASVPHWM